MPLHGATLVDDGGDLGATARHARPLFVPAFLLLVTAGTLALGALVPRDLSLGEDAPIWNTSRDLLAFDLSRAITAVALLASVATITLATIRKGFPRAGLSIWLSYLAFILSNFVLPGFAGQVPGFDYRLLLPPVAFTAVYFAQPMATDQLVALCKSALLAFVYSSLAAAVLMPAQALAAYAEGIFPGLPVRLYGLGGGATSLGPSRRHTWPSSWSPGRHRAGATCTSPRLPRRSCSPRPRPPGSSLSWWRSPWLRAACGVARRRWG